MTARPPRILPAEQRQRARDLRTNATPAERALWQQLRASRLGGHKFSRQIVIGPYIADFVCRQARLVIEVDGSQHTPETDAARQRYLEAQGYRVLRFRNAEVMQGMDAVLSIVLDALMGDCAHPRPLPHAGGEKET